MGCSEAGAVVGRIQRLRSGGWLVFVHGAGHQMFARTEDRAKAVARDGIRRQWEADGRTHRYTGRFTFVPVAKDGDGWVVRSKVAS